MTSPTLPTIRVAKELAKDLRASTPELSHAKALERIAHQHGFRDWNVMQAAIRDQAKPDWQIGDTVTGRYLSQRFAATIRAVEPVRPGWVRIDLDLDEAVDVVAFEAFSNHRKRIQGVIGPKGHSNERTSDGLPQLQLD